MISGATSRQRNPSQRQTTSANIHVIPGLPSESGKLPVFASSPQLPRAKYESGGNPEKEAAGHGVNLTIIPIIRRSETASDLAS
jgi:hypothetical protein